MAISKEQIFAAANDISATGQKPTLEAVRKVTGGSYTTISPLLNEWKLSQKRRAEAPREPVPTAVNDSLLEFASQVWTVALTMADDRLANERESLEKTKAELEASQSEAVELADSLSTLLDGAREKIEALEKSVEQTRIEAEKRVDQLAAAIERTATSEAKLKAAEELLHDQRQNAASEAMRAAELLTRVQQERDDAIRDASLTREKAAGLEGQLEATQTQLGALLARLPGSETGRK